MAPERAREIPVPHLTSWMHARVPTSHVPSEESKTRYYEHQPDARMVDALTSRIFKWLGMGRPTSLWPLYRVLMGLVRTIFKVLNRLEVRGRENIPPGGAIFFINHRGNLDVLLFLAAFGRPAGVFTDIGNSWIADAFERFLGFVPRRGLASEMVEKMIAVLARRQRYFAMWPEGSPSHTGEVMQGFSGIVKVYAVLNSRKDVVPFVPVLMRGIEGYQDQRRKRFFKKWAKKAKQKKVKKSRPPRAKPKASGSRFQKILVEFLKPIYLPRSWLQPPQEGGKSPRQIIDALMLVLARKIGQEKLAVNHRLEARRQEGGAPWHD